MNCLRSSVSPPTNELRETVHRMNNDVDLKAMTATMHKVVDLSKRKKAQGETLWPLGSRPQDEAPL